MRGGIRNIDNYFHQVVPIDDFTLTPMALDILCFVTGGAKMIHDLQNRVRQPVRRYLTPVVKLKGKQDLESPLLAAHRSPFP